MTTDLESRRDIDVAGSTMSVIDTGAGEAVVLAHSYLWDAEMWRPQIDVLSRHYRVIIPELWGHGRSGALPEDTNDLRDIARHHLLLMDRLQVDRFTFVGLSVGGMWGAELALLAPERLQGLVLMDTYLGPEPESSRRNFFAMLDAVAASGSVPDPLLDMIVPMFFSPDIETRAPHLPVAFRERLAGLDGGRLRDGVVEIGRLTFGRRDILADMDDLAVPTLVMTGSQDIPRPISEGRHMAEVLGCPFIELPGAGHLSSLEAPETVTRHLLAFLADRAGRISGSSCEVDVRSVQRKKHD